MTKSESPSATCITLRLLKSVMSFLRSTGRTAKGVANLLTSWLASVVTKSRLSSTNGTNCLTPKKTLVQFTREMEALLSETSDLEGALRLSEGMQEQFREALKDNMACMLPSFNHQLPTGQERGTFLALDVGGSTFRIAVVELLGVECQEGRQRIVVQRSFKITDQIKQLDGYLFFDWLAEKIEESIKDSAHISHDLVLPMGLSWSFPIGQTSLRSGLIQGLGKGFVGANTLLGQCLGDTIQAACDKRKLKVKLNAIVNDSNATLLAKAYTDPSARFSLILGTGTNIAVQLPVDIFGPAKFGTRPSSWHDVAKNVLVNSELSAFGKGHLPMTRWDDELNAMHERPNAEPFEYLVSGRYIGEIVRLILVEAAQESVLFDGQLPSSLKPAYSLDTEVLSRMAATSDIEKSRAILNSYHQDLASITDEDLSFIKSVAHHVSQRAVSVVASGIHSLWCLRRDSYSTSAAEVAEIETTTIACDGSVIQSYPAFREECEKMVNLMVAASGGGDRAVDLEMTFESSLLGAAVAVACV